MARGNESSVPQNPSLVNPTAPEEPLGTVNCRELGREFETGRESATTVSRALLRGCHAANAADVSKRN